MDKFQETLERAYFQYQEQDFASPPIITPSHTTTSSSLPFIPSLHLQVFTPSTPPPPDPLVMARFALLILPQQLTALPQNYGQILPLFYGTLEVTSHQHIVKVVDFIYLGEIDNDDAKMHIIAQSFSGQVKRWFLSLTAGSIGTSK